MEVDFSLDVKGGLMATLRFIIEKWSRVDPTKAWYFCVRVIAVQSKLKQLPKIESTWLNLIDESNIVFRYRISPCVPVFHSHLC